MEVHEDGLLASKESREERDQVFFYLSSLHREKKNYLLLPIKNYKQKHFY